MWGAQGRARVIEGSLTQQGSVGGIYIMGSARDAPVPGATQTGLYNEYARAPGSASIRCSSGCGTMCRPPDRGRTSHCPLGCGPVCRGRDQGEEIVLLQHCCCVFVAVWFMCTEYVRKTHLAAVVELAVVHKNIFGHQTDIAGVASADIYCSYLHNAIQTLVIE